MGWNKHVDHIETECLDCGEINIWEYWNEIAKARYGGANRHLGALLGHDDSKSDRCPHCGSTKGKFVEDEDDDDDYDEYHYDDYDDSREIEDNDEDNDGDDK